MKNTFNYTEDVTFFNNYKEKLDQLLMAEGLDFQFSEVDYHAETNKAEVRLTINWNWSETLYMLLAPHEIEKVVDGQVRDELTLLRLYTHALPELVNQYETELKIMKNTINYNGDLTFFIDYKETLDEIIPTKGLIFEFSDVDVYEGEVEVTIKINGNGYTRSFLPSLTEKQLDELTYGDDDELLKLYKDALPLFIEDFKDDVMVSIEILNSIDNKSLEDIFI